MSFKPSQGCSVAMAVQRGNAMTFLEGYDRALHAALAKHAASAKQKAMVEQEEDDRGIETTESEGESEDEHDDGRGRRKRRGGREGDGAVITTMDTVRTDRTGGEGGGERRGRDRVVRRLRGGVPVSFVG